MELLNVKERSIMEVARNMVIVPTVMSGIACMLLVYYAMANHMVDDYLFVGTAAFVGSIGVVCLFIYISMETWIELALAKVEAEKIQCVQEDHSDTP